MGPRSSRSREDLARPLLAQVRMEPPDGQGVGVGRQHVVGVLPAMRAQTPTLQPRSQTRRHRASRTNPAFCSWSPAS
jgi:hypothetical protein